MKGKTNVCLLILCALCATFLFACGGAKTPDTPPKQDGNVQTEGEKDGDSETDETDGNAEENTPPVDENNGEESGVGSEEGSEVDNTPENGGSEESGSNTENGGDYSVGGVDIFKPQQ